MSEKTTGKKWIKEALSTVDVFDDSIHLNMEGQRTLGSYLGSILSLSIIIFLGIQAINQLVIMFDYRQPTIIQIEDYQDDPETISFNSSNNFVMAVGVKINNKPLNFSEKSIVSFNSHYCHYIRDVDGTTTKIKSKIGWAPCNRSNFPTSVFPETTFDTYSLSYAYCPTYVNFTDSTTGICPDSVKETYPDCIAPPYFDIRGTFLSFDFEFIQLKLTTCKSSDAAYIQGLECDSADNINTRFSQNEVQLGLYFSNNLILPVNYHTPNKTHLDNIYWNVDPSVAKVADIFVDGVTIQNIDSFIDKFSYTNSTFYNIRAEKMRELQEFHGSSMLSYNIRRSNLNLVTSRRYTKFLEVVSNIGGLQGLFMLFGAFIIGGYTKYKYQMILSNELYDFQPIETKRPSQKKLTLQKTLTEITSGATEVSECQDTKESKALFGFLTSRRSPRVANVSTVKDYFDLQSKKERILPYNESKYMKHLLMKIFCKKDPEEELAKKARSQVMKDLDVIKIIEKLQEIDKLKNLLLNKYQREAFNFIEKPVITLNDHNPVHRESVDYHHIGEGIMKNPKSLFSERKEYKSLSKYAKLYTAYKRLSDDHDPGNWKYNKKLLDMIDEDLMKVFKHVDSTLGNDPDPHKFEEIINNILNKPADGVFTVEQIYEVKTEN